MRAIGSSNEYYLVTVRGMDKPIKMSAIGGQKLAEYLVSNDVKNFVLIKDTDGSERTVRVMTIDRVEKYKGVISSYKTPSELGLPELVTDDDSDADLQILGAYDDLAQAMAAKAAAESGISDDSIVEITKRVDVFTHYEDISSSVNGTAQIRQQ